jgi:histidine triad (HIT) family protein
VTTGCTFCAIVAGTEPAEHVTGTERAIAFVNQNPAGLGHMLVIPKAHADDIWDVSEEDGLAVWSLVRQMAELARLAYEPDGLNLFQANRKAGWQSEFHFHVHIVPRWIGDPLVPNWGHLSGNPLEVAAMGERLRTNLG